jgi:hypothetical protein
MFKEKVLDALKQEQKDTPNKKTSQTIAKIQKQKRLTSEEFFKVHDTLWKKGPEVKYKDPDNW